METMQPIASTEVPNTDDFLYEVKFDGYRAMLNITETNVHLISRNNTDLTNIFPEITELCRSARLKITSLLPLTLDGEIVILNNRYQGNFSVLQRRGRLRNRNSIHLAANQRPANFMAFDLLQYRGKDCKELQFTERKLKLQNIFESSDFKQTLFPRLRFVHPFEDVNKLWNILFEAKGEGIVAKRKNSKYSFGKSHHDWFKQKNWRTVYGFLTEFNLENNYFTVAVFNNKQLLKIGKCKHGLDGESFRALKQLFIKEGKKKSEVYSLPPAICAEILTLDLHGNELREAEFAKLLPNEDPKKCTLKRLKMDLAMLPNSVSISNEDKLLWPKVGATKGDLLIYIREISNHMLPFINERPLTVIRSPDGVTEESFFQKSLPSYAPDFINRVEVKDKQLILCNSMEALVWFANHGAVEYHVPFQTVNQTDPIEIVFDLDPPTEKQFQLAVKAALLIKRLLDNLQLYSYVKTSGNKGMQIHIPIKPGSMTYKETAIFTEAIAKTVENEDPTSFTTERLKKKRNKRLYIDYVQHGKDKTIIAPYSPRKTNLATVATPLFWEEVNESLNPKDFTIFNVFERVQQFGCPFADYFSKGEQQRLNKVLQLVKF